jgi:hypothetical protein
MGAGRLLALLSLMALVCGRVSAFIPNLPITHSCSAVEASRAWVRRSSHAVAVRRVHEVVRGPAVCGVRSMKSSDIVDGVAVVLLAGGVGSRMKADRPKQFLELDGKPVLHHSLELFMRLEGINSITVVSNAHK